MHSISTHARDTLFNYQNLYRFLLFLTAFNRSQLLSTAFNLRTAFKQTQLQPTSIKNRLSLSLPEQNDPSPILVNFRPKIERKSPREAKKNKESKESGQKAKNKPNPALTARPRPPYGAPAPSLWRARALAYLMGKFSFVAACATQMVRPRHSIS
ncbi:hypothetical protein PIB30_037611 [Stylosanthes scabra]|uniref:Uncharacterized protein n=1 Tax=Stylosanthes scabra TaxID=79078 RepID=A0ABU6ZCR2_9FABA|nr:hypothetical protein [Stylosanthes scabra]